MKLITRFTFLAALCGGALSAVALAASTPAPLNIHIISGSEEYKSEPSLQEFSAYLKKIGFDCTASWGKDKGKTLPNLTALAQADLMIVFARRLTLPEEQMKIVRAHWESGKPIIGLRTASHAWGEKDNPDVPFFDQKVLGNNYSGHFGDEPVRVTNAPEHSTHPVLQGVQPFTSRKLYKNKAPTATVLQFGDNGKSREAITLVNEYKGGRVFYTSLGVPEDFKDENFRRMLVNAIYWTTRREPPDGK